MIRAGVLTLSDKGAAGEREDLSGRIACEILEDSGGVEVVCYEVIPDERDMIVSKLIDWCDNKSLDLVVTTGGTGLSPRDVTPEATMDVIDKRVPGMEEAMRMESLSKTPHAMISRAVVGVRGKSLIINLPGSPGGVKDCLGVVMVAIPHALEKIAGDTTECAPTDGQGDASR